MTKNQLAQRLHSLADQLTEGCQHADCLIRQTPLPSGSPQTGALCRCGPHYVKQEMFALADLVTGYRWPKEEEPK